MNLVIGLVIIICLMVSELTVTAPVDDVWQRVIVMLVTMMLVPGLAVFQVFIFNSRTQRQATDRAQHFTILRRISVCHSAVWLAASLAIVCAVQWQNVVRGNWGLDAWPLLDEIVILLPIVLSLVFSWAIFYEIQKSLFGYRKSQWRDRWDYVSLRLRIYVGIVVVPIGILILMRDLLPESDTLNPGSTFPLALASLAGLLALFPFALLWVCRNRDFENPATKASLMNICRKHKMRITNIRIWNTGNRVINALVSGVFPYFRMVMLSDGLVRSFPQNELEAILKHEAGHIRLGHMLTRIAFVILPIVGVTCGDFLLSAAFGDPLSVFATVNPDTLGTHIVGAIAYSGYLMAVVAWLSRNMEHEADLYAVGAFGRCNSEADETGKQNSVQSMADALLRFGQFHPEQYHRPSFTHPSLLQRIEVIRKTVAWPASGVEFRRRFVRRQLVFGLAVFGSIPVLMLLLR